jgi:hypothetical protein
VERREDGTARQSLAVRFERFGLQLETRSIGDQGRQQQRLGGRPPQILPHVCQDRRPLGGSQMRHRERQVGVGAPVPLIERTEPPPSGSHHRRGPVDAHRAEQRRAHRQHGELRTVLEPDARGGPVVGLGRCVWHLGRVGHGCLAVGMSALTGFR